MKTEKQKRAEYTKLIHEGENIVIAPPGTINGEGGGETDVYTKAEVDTMIGTIDDQLDNVYTKEEVDEAIDEIDLSDKMDKENPTGTGTLSINRKAETEIGEKSVCTGSNCTASAPFSNASGRDTIASAYEAHAEGYGTHATGEGSHAENTNCYAIGSSSHAGGNGSRAFGVESFVHGYQNYARNSRSTVFGMLNSAFGRSMLVFGECCINEGAVNADTRSSYIEIVGNGTSDNNRSNARTLDWSGNEWLAGYILPVNGVILPSSTPNSTKYFKLSVDDTGTITATEVTI